MTVNYQEALTYASLAQEIYADFDTIRFGAFPDASPALFTAPTTDTQAAIIPADSETIILIFRGTEAIDDWKTNVNFSRALFEIRTPSTAESNQPRSRQILPHPAGVSRI